MTIRQSDLIAAARMRNFSKAAMEVLNESYSRDARVRGHRAFLSHSHLDEELALGLKNKMASSGINLYIDWLDRTMPEETSLETALKIQEAIRSCDYFFYLVTENSSRSIWCPWELGYADGIERLRERIFVIPTLDKENLEHGKEYLGLYQILDEYNDNGSPRFAYHTLGKDSKYLWFDA